MNNLRNIYLFVITSLLLASCMFSPFQPSNKKLYQSAQSKHSTYDAIIVPGVPYYGYNWDQTMQIRVLWAKHLYDSGITKNIIFSGSAVYSPYRESTVMALYALELGIPAEAIIEEPLAEHSSENVYYGFLQAKDHGFKKIALATDPFQTKMVRPFAIKNQIPVDYLPIQFNKLQAIDRITPRINPDRAFVTNFKPLTEREGFWERFQGTLGKKVVWRHTEEVQHMNNAF